MKLLARLILVAAGMVHLPAILAGRIACSLGLDLARIAIVEVAAGAAGGLLGCLVMGLGRRRRPRAARAFSNYLAALLGMLWLILYAAEYFGFSRPSLWLGATAIWSLAAFFLVVTYLSFWGALERPRRDFRWPDR